MCAQPLWVYLVYSVCLVCFDVKTG